jgi:hypothetical protein
MALELMMSVVSVLFRKPVNTVNHVPLYLQRIHNSRPDPKTLETSTGLHVATGYTRVVIGGRGPYIEFLPGHLIWDSLQIPDEEKYRLEHPWKDRVYYVEWRTKDESNVKVYDQKRSVDYADYRVGLVYISPFDLFVEGEPVITKLEKEKSRSGPE